MWCVLIQIHQHRPAPAWHSGGAAIIGRIVTTTTLVGLVVVISGEATLVGWPSNDHFSSCGHKAQKGFGPMCARGARAALGAAVLAQMLSGWGVTVVVFAGTSRAQSLFVCLFVCLFGNVWEHRKKGWQCRRLQAHQCWRFRRPSWLALRLCLGGNV